MCAEGDGQCSFPRRRFSLALGWLKVIDLILGFVCDWFSPSELRGSTSLPKLRITLSTLLCSSFSPCMTHFLAFNCFVVDLVPLSVLVVLSQQCSCLGFTLYKSFCRERYTGSDVQLD